MMIEPSVPGMGGHALANDKNFLQYLGRERTPERRQRLINELQWPLQVLEGELSKSAWLVGDRFTGADLNVSVVLGWAPYLGKEFLANFPIVSTWLDKCWERPSSPYSRPPPDYAKTLGVPGHDGNFPFDAAGFEERYAKL